MIGIEIVRNHYMQGANQMLFELRRQNHGPSQSLSNALDAFFNHITLPEEQSYIARIESLRKKLATSRDQISIMDYGAVSPTVRVSCEELGRGKSITRTVGQTCKSGSIPPSWGMLLFKLIREFKPSVVLELGTSLGISTAYQTAALELNDSGKIVSLEGADALATLARRNLAELGLRRATVRTGPFKETLEGVLQELKPIDYAFIDGHHEEQATLMYFEQILPCLSTTALLVFDDIFWSDGMRRAWTTIIADSRIKIAVDLSKLGICVIASSLEQKQFFKHHLSYWRKALARVSLGVRPNNLLAANQSSENSVLRKNQPPP